MIWFSDETQLDLSESIRGREFGLVPPCICERVPGELFVCKCDNRHKPRNQQVKSSLRIMVWAAVNAHHKAIWYIVPKIEGKKGIDSQQYIEVMEKFRSALAARNIDSSRIIYQQGILSFQVISRSFWVISRSF